MDKSLNFGDVFKKGILDLDFFSKVSVIDVFICMLLTLGVCMFIFYIYKKTFSGVVYNHNYNVALVLMGLITALIIITISSNVVLSLGMVGALSIVRFRTALKDPMDIVFMFWTISVGIASGAGVYSVSIFGSLIIGAVIVGLDKIKSKETVFLLIIHYEEIASDELKRVLSRIKYSLKSKTISSGVTELTVEIKIKDNNTAIMNQISVIKGVNNAVLVSYNGEYAA